MAAANVAEDPTNIQQNEVNPELSEDQRHLLIQFQVIVFVL